MDTPGISINRDVLKRVSLFAVLSDAKLECLARACRHRRHERGATILSAGEAVAGVYVLLSGRGKVMIEDAAGRQMTLSMLEANDLFGEMGVFDETEWAAQVEALTHCESLYIPRRAFLEGIEGNFDAAILMLRTVLARLRRADHKIASLGLLDVYGRVARLFVESAEYINGQWIVAAGSEEIGRSVAASREMVSRVVKKMAADGLVRREKRKTVIVDRALMAGKTARTVG